MLKSKWVLVLGGFLLYSNVGCIVVGVTGCHRTRVWTDSVSETINLDDDLSALSVRTHNGAISFDGQPGTSGGASVIVTKKAGGHTMDEADEAFDAIEVFVDSDGPGAQKIGWKWATRKRMGWSANVSFDITAPGVVRLDVETHNGPIKVDGAASGARAVTHNGRIRVDSSGTELHAETHNGSISAAYTGEDLTLITHNGQIVANLDGCSSVRGAITTHNGSVDVLVGAQTSASLSCRSNNGGIRCDVPLTEETRSRRRLTGVLGSGGGKLDVSTHNGGVRIKNAG